VKIPKGLQPLVDDCPPKKGSTIAHWQCVPRPVTGSHSPCGGSTDVDGNSTTQTGSILIADPQADAVATLAWGGALAGDWGSGGNNLPPEIITQPAVIRKNSLSARRRPEILMVQPTENGLSVHDPAFAQAMA
jgi:hypothetical protein